MRISGGGARGIPLRVPRGDAVRPATDSLRQAVFSSLGGRVTGSRFLDLFAGSGAYGLEALSRGATGGVFVEKAPLAIGCLRHNLAAVCRCLGRGLDDLAIRRADVLKLKWDGLAVPDLVFVDPPYELLPAVVPRLFPQLDALLAGHPEALVVLEFPGGTDPEPPGWHCLRQLGRSGARQPNVRIFQRKSAA